MISASAALTGSYDYNEVARSVLIAIVASYAALDLTGRVTAARGRVRLAWLSGGAIAMGIGIWAMHFKGVLALRLPVPVEYHWPTVLASLLVAILASGVALYVASRRQMGLVAALTGSMFMATGIAGMHYIGMAAMRLPATTRYSSFLVICSILLAILFSLIALLMAFDLREETRWSVPRRLGSATVMGAAVSAMHYTGMAAASFIPASPADLSHAVTISPLANNGIAIVTLIVIVAAITTSSVDRRRSEHRLELVIDTAPSMLHSSSPDGYVDFFNKRWLEYLGASLEEIGGWRWTKVIHPADVEDVVDGWRSSLATGRPFEAEARLRRADEEYRLMLLRMVPLRDEAGGIVKWYGSATDIEDRKRTEEELKVSEEKHRVIVEAASDVVISMDESGSILLANPATARIFGYDPVELIAKPLTILMPEFMRKLYEAAFRRYLATGQRHLNWQGTELTALRKNGQEFPVEVSFGEMISNGHRVFTGFIRDISEKKRAEDVLRRQKEVFQKIFENIPVTISFISKDRRLELVNPAWEHTTGWTLEEIRKQSPDLLAEFYPDPQYRQWILELIAASTGEWCDCKVRVRDGRVIDLAMAVVHLSDGTTLAIGRDITERKRAEEALRTSVRHQHEIAKQLEAERARLLEAQAVAKVGSWEAELPSLEITWSEQTHRIFETDPSHFHPSRPKFVESIHPADRAKVDAAFQASLDKGAPSNVEYRIVMADSRVKVLEEQWRVFHDEQGRPIRLMGTCRDITERKRAEEALRRAAEFDEAALKSLGEGLYTTDTNGLVTSMNPAAEELFGWRFAELCGKKMHDMTHHHYRDGRPFPSFECVGFQVLTHGQPLKNYEDVFIRKNGTFFDVIYSIAPMRDAAGQISGLVVVFSDITERKRAEERLLESEARFRLVADSAPVMIWMSGKDKLCTYFNKPWLDFTGRSIDRELGNGWAEGVDPEDLQRCMDTYIQAFDRRELFRMEYRFRRYDGEYRRVLDIGAPRFNPDGSFAGYIGSCIDVTEQRRAEDQLQQAQENLARVTRVVAMGELAAAIAHEVNQPLTAIVTNSQFCLRRLDGATSKPEELRSAITAIVSDSTRASGIISRIRGLLMKGSPDRTELDINRIILDVTSLMRKELTRNRVSLRTELAYDLAHIRGDPLLLQQVLINLIMNAIEATHSFRGGRREILIRSAKNPGSVLVQVQDSGPGIAPGLADRIFEPFFTTKAEGIGMGLSISHSVVESHGGHLRIVPSPTGALFEFTLPTD